MRTKRILAWAGGIILLCMFLLLIYLYPFYEFFFTTSFRELDKNLVVMSGAGNSSILFTDSTVVVIDTKMGPMAKKLRKFAEEKAGNRKIIVINTHYHGDHIFGNRYFADCLLYIGSYSPDFLESNIKPEDMPNRFVADSLVMNLGNETLVLLNTGRGHTFDDMVVYLRNRKTLIAGDLVFNAIHPALMKEAGANVENWQKILKHLSSRWEIKTVIPGHGDPGNISLIIKQSTYFEDMRIAAAHPENKKEMKNKYSSWMKMPFMASAEKTIEFIREEQLRP